MNNYCPNCGSNKIDKYGLDENGGMYKCIKCKIFYSLKVYKDGDYINKKVNKTI
jgi:hypothetical protein